MNKIKMKPFKPIFFKKSGRSLKFNKIHSKTEFVELF